MRWTNRFAGRISSGFDESERRPCLPCVRPPRLHRLARCREDPKLPAQQVLDFNVESSVPAGMATAYAPAAADSDEELILHIFTRWQPRKNFCAVPK